MTTAHPASNHAARMFENVVVGTGTDDEAADDAVALAQQLVAPRGRVTLVHILVVADRPAPDSGSMQATAKYRHAMAELTDRGQQLAVATQVACVEAPSVRRGLHDFASARDADLLVMGASRSDEAARLLLGGDTVEVLEEPPCPVVVAPEGYAARNATIHRIGVAYDGSIESERALGLARTLAVNLGAELSAFEAVQAPVYLHDVWDVRGEMDHQLEEARQQVAALGDVEGEAEYGNAVDELTRYAHSVDLLVIGSHRYRPIDRLSQRTTSQQLADRTESPLLVLSSNERACK